MEGSFYVRLELRRKGVGSQLLGRLIAEAKYLGLHLVRARIGSRNKRSIGLHRKLGFMGVGLLRQVGFKFGRWLDVMMELLVKSSMSTDCAEKGNE